jgi:uroporphyrinogen-III synthase
MRIVVTRPEPECASWVQNLGARGLQALALPLIRIGPVVDTQFVHQCWSRLGQYNAVMFVSGAAAEHFFALRPAGAGVPGTTRFWAPGPGTAAALVRQQVSPAQVDAPDAASGAFDSEALWRVVGHQVHAGWQVLIVRGGDEAAVEPPAEGAPPRGQGREWLAQVLGQAGARVELVMAYERTGPVWDAATQARAQAAAVDGSVWLFTSSQAIAHLKALLPAQTWQQSSAVATHPRIAQAARDAGFGVVWESRPRLDDVVASIESRA